MAEDIRAIMEPQSIAVIGATDRPGSVGRAVVTNIIEGGFTGVLYPINPKAKSVVCNKAYASISQVPGPVDMAVVIVPAPYVAQVVKEAADKGVKGVVIITAGFKEVSGQGVEMENELKAIAVERGIRIVGPNCLGVINTAQGFSMNASFAQHMPKPGNIGFISQSGALCTAVLDLAAGMNIGFSKFISFGNKADVNESELLEYLANDPDTQVILMYLEDISDGRKFVDTAGRTTLQTQKPILAIKSGRSEEGARAVSSHTGSLAGSDMAYDGVFKQCGIQRVEDVYEMFHYADAFSRMPRPQSNRIAIVTNAGGPGIMATDSASHHGLSLARFSPSTLDKLKKNLPSTANIHNPVDVIGDADYRRYEAALEAVLKDEDVGGAIVVLTPQKMTDVLETAQIVPKVLKDCKKPVLCSFMGIVDVSEGVHFLQESGVPNYAFPEAAVRAFQSMVQFSDSLSHQRAQKRRSVTYEVEQDAVERLIAKKLENKDSVYLPEAEASEILKLYGFPLLPGKLVSREEDMEQALDEVGTPVAMKIASRDVVHKFDVGGVALKIKTLAEARDAYASIMNSVSQKVPDAKIDGILVKKMAKGGIEVILGANRDPTFGPMCMFGLGGTFVETIQDVVFRLAPMWEIAAEDMIKAIKGFRILQGVRGKPPADIEAIKDCILRMGQLVIDNPEILEMDLNPVIIHPKGEGCVVADSRIILKKVDPCEKEVDLTCEGTI